MLYLLRTGNYVNLSVKHSRAVLRATKPNSVFQTYIRRFELGYSLNLSVGFIFSPEQKSSDYNFMYSNLRLMLNHIEEPINVFVCHAKKEYLSHDQVFLLNFVVRVELEVTDHYSVDSCVMAFRQKYGGSQPLVVFAPETALTESTIPQVTKLIDVNGHDRNNENASLSEIRLISNYQLLLWLTSFCLLIMGVLLLFLAAMVFRNMRRDVIIGHLLPTKLSINKKSKYLNVFCDRQFQAVLLFMYSVVTVVICQTQIQSIVELLLTDTISCDLFINEVESSGVIVYGNSGAELNQLQSLAPVNRLVSIH